MNNDSLVLSINKKIKTYVFLENFFNIYYMDGSIQKYYTNNPFRDEQIIKDKLLEQKLEQMPTTKNRRLKRELEKYRMYLIIKKAIYENKTTENDLLKKIDFEPIYLPPLTSSNVKYYSYRKIKTLFKSIENK
mgnify:CR=1 FL=1